MENNELVRIDFDFLPIEGKLYYVLDNGGRPFKVAIINNLKITIDKKIVNVYKQVEAGEDTDGEMLVRYDFLVSFKPKRIFIGKSILNLNTEFSGAKDSPEFDGNTILLELPRNKYVFIGSEIFSFTSFSKIVEYYSPVGNSAVPYPFAIDEDGNIYLMIEKLVLSYSEKMFKFLENINNDPYDYWYNYNRNAKNRKIKNYKLIQKRLY
jgi:hypothetical protein